ncbi:MULTISPECIES: hypothetical protein [unclassified Marinobacter]|uniref:hypothetical protein n=1 Tax=unclassified Marinobacter TaxID=83889 RepID=UPI0026E241EA|nr:MULTISPECIES: hypothetical protein [unclassified Marinobacter]MDO6440622.1 hypothetical protein [Marinobacter sp. 2_MG-2023]MDO6823450.1 hypothetical protein [Marinobacter sp. 1_MG-2023]
MRQLGKSVLLALASWVALPAAQAQETGIVTIEGTRIRGDQEVPTVMYIVPWQPPEVDELRAPDEQLMVEQAFSPLERYEFQRLVRYHEAFSSEPVEVKQGN